MATTSKPSFVYVTYIASTPEKVWAALTEGRFSREYWAGRFVESDWQPGSPVTFRKLDGNPDHVRATLLAVTPPSHLEMTWTYDLDSSKERPPASKVTYDVQQAGPGNVKLTVIHEEHEPGSEVDEGVRNGWPAILSSLKSYLETGEALEITRRWGREGR